jgi:hypothetical protein
MLISLILSENIYDYTMENSESILTELKKISYLLSKRQAQVPGPIYLNQ